MASATATARGKKGPAAEALLLGFDDLAVLLNRSVKSLRKDVRSGRMPAPVYRPAGRGKMFWSRSAIQAWLADGCPPVGRRRGKGGASHGR
jgi:hypothetical protein